MRIAPMTALLPDALLVLAIILTELNDLIFGKKFRRLTFWIPVGAAVIVGVLFMMQAIADPDSHYFFYRMVLIDPFGSLMKAVVAFGFAIGMIYSRQYLEDRQLLRSDVILLALFSLLGQVLMISSGNFLSLYLGLEMMSLSLYALTALRQGAPKSSEAAMKYYVLGALASGFVLYGISMIYGAMGSLSLLEVYQSILYSQTNQFVLLFGVVFLLAGIAFKLSVAPFHMWAPDVYDGAPTAMTLMIGGGPKVASFVWAFRFLVMALLPLAVKWQEMLIILAALSLIIGNLTGIAQQNIKRMLAYSAIANMGFVLLGLLSGVIHGDTQATTSAYSSAMFYVLVYFLTTLGTFGVLMLLSKADVDIEKIDDLKGLNQRHPAIAAVMMVMMFSLAGIPPAVGFYAKLAVLQAAVHADLIWLAVLAVITALFGAFYYLRIVKVMYFDQAEQDFSIQGGCFTKALLILNGCAVILLGIFPGPAMSLCYQVMSQTMKSFLF